jgi:hypothetical protein
MHGIGDAPVAGVAGEYDPAAAGRAGDRGGAGVVATSLGIDVGVRVVAELTEDPAPSTVPRPGRLKYR